MSPTKSCSCEKTREMATTASGIGRAEDWVYRGGVREEMREQDSEGKNEAREEHGTLHIVYLLSF